MFHEMCVYHTLPGRMPALHARFREAGVALWSRHGFRQVGIFTDWIGPDCANKLICLLAWESMSERDTKWRAFLADPEWLAACERGERDGRIVARCESSILRPTPYSGACSPLPSP